ncbi:MAG: MotA/TolQ/ExbB proton channel family protein [Chitinispirillaceae bacterium]|nr:MotA/TolQ/ExbB proton channel family protein [Chitinispirillaceae bacterium]
MRIIFVCALTLIIAGTAHSRKNKTDALEIELRSINEMLESVRDSLENEIAARYTFKQHSVEQREADKEEYERLREKQEVALRNLSKIKEEALVKEQNLTDVRNNAKDKKEEWEFVKNGIDELMQKEADDLFETFPIDLERRRGELEAVRQSYAEKSDPLNGWEEFLRYRIEAMNAGRSVTITQEKLLPNEGEARMFSLARFGSVFAYCMDSSQAIYMIHQTGHLGKDRFSIEPVLSEELNGYVRETLPQWIQDNRVSGMVMTEVTQNEQAKMLVEGNKTTAFQKLKSHLKAGGWVMIPLLLLPVWILILVILKVLQFWTRQRKFSRQIAAAFKLIDKNEKGKALTYAKSKKGLMAGILEVCLNSPKNYSAAENAVRKLIFREINILERNINTLAVIAGAAPLLGLLGTISGMIALFAAVTYYGTGDPKFLAGGISEALVTSQTGLAIAIPTLFAHDYIRKQKDRLVADIEAMAQQVLEKTVAEN